jgi:hypothetical protein
MKIQILPFNYQSSISLLNSYKYLFLHTVFSAPLTQKQMKQEGPIKRKAVLLDRNEYEKFVTKVFTEGSHSFIHIKPKVTIYTDNMMDEEEEEDDIFTNRISRLSTVSPMRKKIPEKEYIELLEDYNHYRLQEAGYLRKSVLVLGHFYSRFVRGRRYDQSSDCCFQHVICSFLLYCR